MEPFVAASICNVAHIVPALDECFRAQTVSVLEFINLKKQKSACHLLARACKIFASIFILYRWSQDT